MFSNYFIQFNFFVYVHWLRIYVCLCDIYWYSLNVVECVSIQLNFITWAHSLRNSVINWLTFRYSSFKRKEHAIIFGHRECKRYINTNNENSTIQTRAYIFQHACTPGVIVFSEFHFTTKINYCMNDSLLGPDRTFF